MMAAALLVAIGLSRNRGDDEPVLAIGERLRVHLAASSGGPITGSVIAFDDATLALSSSGASAARAIPRSGILNIERSLRPGRKRRGALLGLGIGFVVGFAGASLLGNCDESGGERRCVDAFWGSVYGSMLAPIGAGVGAAVAPGERWAQVPLDRVRGPRGQDPASKRIDVGIRPFPDGRRGFAVAVTFP